MKVSTILEFCKLMMFVQLSPEVRENVNGYKFITFINAQNEAENIYFSKSASEARTAGEPVTKELLSGHQIAVVTNEAGEERTKLISNSGRVDIEALLG